ncbi:MAG: hypothetical protein JO209_10645 [Acidisphaera sp.]|nr:hypothetical protein [Acidisphaera sp.]
MPIFVSLGSTFTSDGADTIVAGGDDTITLAAPGAFAYGNVDSIITTSSSETVASADDVITTDSADTVVGGNADTLVSAGQGALLAGPVGYQTCVFVNTGGSDTIVSSSDATDTIFAVAGGGTYFINGIAEFVGGLGGPSTIVGAGNATIFGGSAGVLYYPGVGLVGSEFLSDFVAQAGTNTVISGASLSTLEGLTLYLAGAVNGFAMSGAVLTLSGPGSGSQLVAGSGSETIDASGSTGYNTFWAGSGNSLLVGGSGSDFPAPGAPILVLPPATNVFAASGGTTTMVGGAGNNAFEFILGHAGGTDLIQDWNGSDRLAFFGYGANPIASQAVSDGSTFITLTDNTRITIVGISSLDARQIVSA